MKGIKISIFIFALFCIGVINYNDIQAVDKTEIYLEAGESYSETISVKNPVIYKFGEEDQQKVSVSVTSKKLSITAKKVGTAVLYICKDNKKSEATKVRTVKVHVSKKADTFYPDVNNNISHDVDDEDDYTNQMIYVYGGYSFKLTMSIPDLPADVSNDTSGKAAAWSASSLYEVANSNGEALKSAAALSPSNFNGRQRDFKANNVTSIKNAYIKCVGYWTSSTGKQHWTKMRISYVKVYPKPYVNFWANNLSISDIRLNVGETKKFSVNLLGNQSGEYIINGSEDDSDDVEEILVSNPQNFSVSKKFGHYNIKALAPGKSTLTYLADYDSTVTDHNGLDYTRIKKTINVFASDLVAPKIKVTYVGGNVKIIAPIPEGGGACNIFRSTSKNGGYKQIATVFDGEYIDNTADYNQKYYYKATTVEKDIANKYSSTIIFPDKNNSGEEDLDEDDDDEMNFIESEFSNIVEAYKELKTPSIVSIKKIGKYKYKISCSSSCKVSGFKVYDNNKFISISNKKEIVLTLKYGNHSLSVVSYSIKKNAELDDETDYDEVNNENAIFSKQSGVKKVSVIPKLNIVKIKVKKNKKNKKIKKIKLRKDKYAVGYEIVLSYNKKFKKSEKIVTKKNNYKINMKKKKVFVKVRCYVVWQNKKYYSKYAKKSIKA